MSTYEEISEHAKKKGDYRFCVPLALSLTTGIPFDDINDHMFKHKQRKFRHGVYESNWRITILQLGYQLIDVTIPSGVKTPVTLAGRLNRNKKYLVSVNGHLFAYTCGRIQDWTKGRRHRIKAIYEIKEAAPTGVIKV